MTRHDITSTMDQPQAQGLKERLVRVAAALLTEPRRAKLPTMREIAATAGVTPGAAYRHFESQGELFLAVISHLFAGLEAELTSALGDLGNRPSAVRDLASAYVAWGLGNPGGYQLLFETTDEEFLLAQDRRPGLHLITLLAELIDGRAPARPSAIEKATRLWTSLHGVVSLRLHKTGMTWLTTVDTEVDSLVTAIVTRD